MQNLSVPAERNEENQANLKRARAKQKEMIESGELVIDHNLMRKAAADPKSKAKAIAAFCFHCHGGTIDELPDGGWKRFIAECTAPGCPLYPHRPYKK